MWEEADASVTTNTRWVIRGSGDGVSGGEGSSGAGGARDGDEMMVVNEYVRAPGAEPVRYTRRYRRVKS